MTQPHAAHAAPATKLGVNFALGKYFTFSFSVLMMSVSFLPLMVSSNTHICHSPGTANAYMKLVERRVRG